MYYPSPWSCAVCRNPADVWYKQNGSALCSACDIRLQNSNQLESAHVRTALPSCVVVQTTATADQGRSPWDYANSGEGNTDEFRNWSTPCANSVPDVYNEFGAKQSAMVTMPSFESLELFQAGLDDQTFQYGNGDCLNKAACRTVETVEADDAAVPTCPSAAYDPMPADGAGNTLARFAPSQSVNQGLAATTHTSVAAESVPAARDQPSATVDHNVAGQATQPAFAPAMQLPAFCCAPAAFQATPTATYPQMGSQSVPSWAPMQQAMPYVAAMPAMMPMGWHMPLWMTYIPASLQPHHNSSKKEAAERAQIRKRQISRFQGKKQLLSCRKTVRYASRKLYADSRPRVHGRFIRKADVAAPTA